MAIQWIAHHYHNCKKPWVARLVGTHPTMGFERIFIRSSNEKSKNDIEFEPITTPGIYECRYPRRNKDDHGGFRLVWDHKEKGLIWQNIEKSRAIAIARLLDDGVDFEEARKQTKA